MELLQPVFRKDEESAWTVTRSKPSTRQTVSSVVKQSYRSSVLATGNQEVSERTKFAFENDLVTGPVYKRLLFAELRRLPSVPETATSGSRTTAQTQSLLASSYDGVPALEQETSIVEEEDSTPEGVIRILHDSTGFSVSVPTDLRELMSLQYDRTLPKRSLPLVSTLRRHEMEPEEQRFTNAKLILAAFNSEANQMAEALQEGAEINTESDNGLTPLQICTKSSSSGLDIDLLLLYKETDVRRRNADGLTILHQAAKDGNAALFCRLFACREDRRVLDSNGKTPLHVASTSDKHGLAVLRALCTSAEIAPTRDEDYLDISGRTPLHDAAQTGYIEHCAQLINLGFDPAFLSSPACGGSQPKSGPDQFSSLYLAVAEGHISLVRQIFDMRAATSDITGMLKLANAKHHSTHCLLDGVHNIKQDRHAMADLLVSSGVDWRSAWKRGDIALSFACSCSSPRLLLRLLCLGCIPSKIKVNISRFITSISAGENRELLLVTASVLPKMFLSHKTENLLYANYRVGVGSNAITLPELLTRALEETPEKCLQLARFLRWKTKLCEQSIGPSSTHEELFQHYQSLMTIARNLPSLEGAAPTSLPSHPTHASHPSLYRYA